MLGGRPRWCRVVGRNNNSTAISSRVTSSGVPNVVSVVKNDDSAPLPVASTTGTTIGGSSPPVAAA
jgi:hypothetical protein